jgi:hypothetical protein
MDDALRDRRGLSIGVGIPVAIVCWVLVSKGLWLAVAVFVALLLLLMGLTTYGRRRLDLPAAPKTQP